MLRTGIRVFANRSRSFGTQSLFTKSHEWLRDRGDKIEMGLTDVSQKSLGDIVHIELPKTGVWVEANKCISVVESVKGASDVFSPVSGTVVQVNNDLETDPGSINRDPYGKGWICAIRSSQPLNVGLFMTRKEYGDFCGDQ